MNNGMGRQRSHHQRQYSSSDNSNGMFSENGRWLQSAGLQHLQNNNSSSSSLPPLQVFFFFLPRSFNFFSFYSFPILRLSLLLNLFGPSGKKKGGKIFESWIVL
jgi:hypothetical protein